jgi:hypothetical protein
MLRSSAVLTFFLGALAVATMGSAEENGALAGRVIGGNSPIPTVSVYAYQLADLDLSNAITDRDGIFFFEGLPAGLYKVIAFKRGFLPAVVMLTRTTAQAPQFLEVVLDREPRDRETAEAAFWKIRRQIPADVLRDIQHPTILASEESKPSRSQPALRTEMQALAGVHEGLSIQEGQLSGARVGIEGHVRDLMIGFDGTFSELESSGLSIDGENPNGSSQAVSLEVASSERSRVNVATHSNRLVTYANGNPSNVDFEHHRVSWSQKVGTRGRSDVTAQYTAENNFYRRALIRPNWIPESSRSWRLEGSYSTTISERSTLSAGLRYSERESQYRRRGANQPLLPRESVELFGKGGWELKPAVVLQYGLYSTLHDGSLSLSPQGGVVVQLSPNWSASTLASRRINQKDPERDLTTDFTPAYYQDRESCRRAEEYCYQLLFSRFFREGENLSFGAVHRKVGETQRLFFDDDFFDHLESLYLVEGDELPELRFELTRRLAPAIIARLESSLAAGGGGILQTSARKAFENEVRYLVTSFDTQFEGSSTGVYLAFYRLEQELNPVTTRKSKAPGLELERWKLGVTQDLGFLATDLAVHLDMELSRGGSSSIPADTSEDVRRRVTGGIAVRF